MHAFVASLRRDVGRLAVALGGMALVFVLIRMYSTAGQLPIAVLLIPVLGIALVAEGPATGVVAAVAIALGAAEYESGQYLSTDLRLRFAALIAGSVIAVGLAAARSNRELALRRQSHRLDAAQARAATEVILQVMVQRLPELTAADDVVTASARACVLARDLFGADAVSYWHLEGDDAVLWARVPDEGPYEVGTRQPRPMMRGAGPALELSRTVWVRRSEVTDPERARVMERFGAAVGTSTPVMLSGSLIGYLTMSWAEEREQPDPFWLDALDRFADQMAVAKTVIRRRVAQQEAQNLARRFQAGMLPDLPPDGPIAVRSLYRPGLSQMLLGGDFLDARVDELGRVCFVLGDVAGHGPEQAALGATLRGAWRGLCSLPDIGVEEWAQALDAVVRETGDPVDFLFATAVLGWVDPRTRLLAYVSAGHPPPLVLSRGSAITAPLGDLPLGLHEETKFTLHVVDLTDAVGVLLVTDGLFEGRRAPGEGPRFDHESFIELVLDRGLDDLDGPGYLDSLADEMERRNGTALPDDAAALLLHLEPARTDRA